MTFEEGRVGFRLDGRELGGTFQKQTDPVKRRLGVTDELQKD